LSVAEKTNLLNLDRAAMQEFFVGIGEKPFRATQVIQWIHQYGVDDFDAMTNLGKELRARLRDTAEIRVPEIIQDQIAADGTRKWLLRLERRQRHRDGIHPGGGPGHAVRVFAGRLHAQLLLLLHGPPGFQPQPDRG
jgi:23S rRNA (adenine2503-C2)-methyltransferase